MTTPEQQAAPAAPLPMPQTGGAWVRLPDGSLQREEPEVDRSAPLAKLKTPVSELLKRL